MKAKSWRDHLWVITVLYFLLSPFSIALAWIGMVCFLFPLGFAFFKGDKGYCNRYCGRGQLFDILGRKFGLSLNWPSPKFLYSKLFRYGFLVFFMTMFLLMIYNTVLVFAAQAPLEETITLLWAFDVPWNRAHAAMLPPWAAQFGFGLFSLMMTSMILGTVSMIFFKPRSWCAFCPMGTMTQMICQIKNRNDPQLRDLKPKKE